MFGVPVHRPDPLEEQRRLAEAVRQLLAWQQGPGQDLDHPYGQLKLIEQAARRGDFDYPPWGMDQ